MITFDYQCSRCNHETEEIVRNSDEIVNCPKCGGKMNRLFTVPRSLITDTITPGGFFSNQLNMRVDSRSDIKRELDRRGWGSEDFNMAVRHDEPKPYRVAQDIVDAHTETEVMQKYGGKVSKKKYRELQEKNSAILSGSK